MENKHQIIWGEVLIPFKDLRGGQILEQESSIRVKQIYVDSYSKFKDMRLWYRAQYVENKALVLEGYK